LFKSTDSGANWSPINTGLGDLLDASANVNALILDPDHPNILYLAASGYGMFKSSDGGATWAAFNDGLTFLDVRAPGDRRRRLANRVRRHVRRCFQNRPGLELIAAWIPTIVDPFLVHHQCLAN
jgi:hypothetical protein